ncbi:MAG TPA: PIN domain-containing protein [Candidatus Baltobacteraceae bacterium]|nr:PIN domain-containing protein [Candidatus Baltobacteraceae bacterium]
MIILDTSLLVSYEVSGDSNHAKAADLMVDIASGRFGNIVLSDYIFDETLTVTLVRGKSLEKAVAAGKRIREGSSILGIDKDIFEAAWTLFEEQSKSKFSFTDCTTLALMEYNGIKNIATFDKEFTKIKGINVISQPLSRP